MKLTTTIAILHTQLEKIMQQQMPTTVVEQLCMDQLDIACALDFDDAAIAAQETFAWVEFRDGYMRLQLGQEAYDQLLESISTDILTQAILELEVE